MKKIKIYLDTSVISHLLAEDTPEKMADTRKLWKQLQYGQYEVYVSETTMDEIAACSDPKRTCMEQQLSTISFSLISVTFEIEKLAQ